MPPGVELVRASNCSRVMSGGKKESIDNCQRLNQPFVTNLQTHLVIK